jgi:hypothetical protein
LNRVAWRDEIEGKACPTVNKFNPTFCGVLSQPLTADDLRKIEFVLREM